MAIRKIINKDKPDFATTVVKNAETSATLALGSPVIFQCNGTNDGLAVIAPSSSTAIKATSLFGGVLTRALVPGDIGDAMISGFCQNLLLTKGTRSATTAAWPSFVAVALGDILIIDTVANAFGYSTIGAAGSNAPLAVVADSSAISASTTTAASSAYSAYSVQTAYTLLIKAIIRNM